MLVWGERDRYLGLELTEGLERHVPDLRLLRVPEAGHWVHWDAPEPVNQALLRFFSPPAAGAG